MSWHGYIVIEQPTALTAKQWPDVMKALGIRWNTTPANKEQCKRLAVRYSLDGTKAIVESNFDVDDLVTTDEAKFASVVSIASKDALMTAKVAATMFEGKVTVFPGATRAESAAACREYLAKNSKEWELPMETEPSLEDAGPSLIDKIVTVMSKALRRVVTSENKWEALGIA